MKEPLYAIETFIIFSKQWIVAYYKHLPLLDAGKLICTWVTMNKEANLPDFQYRAVLV